ncbi:hypothetical protein GCWU000322_00077 [Eubacterium saphenum ATCC 49989]|nr:hypothetical protein GCWU000322_00077 [Eubacterium saphenum ATCC 49989]
MLSKATVQKMTDYFFGGEPEKAYELVSSMAEWGQFEASTSDLCEGHLAYDIMCRSDLSVWQKHVPPPFSEDYPTYRGEIKLPKHIVIRGVK